MVDDKTNIAQGGGGMGKIFIKLAKRDAITRFSIQVLCKIVCDAKMTFRLIFSRNTRTL